jgi:alpha-galactosidase
VVRTGDGQSDSELYRRHPDWILATGERLLRLVRHQQVLDLGRTEVREYLLAAMGAILSTYRIDYVKWDHNRDLVDAGSTPRAGAPGVHAQTLGFYALLDELRTRHPDVEWESCASGGGQIDLGVLERVQRVWTSDVTDALSRQHVQRWTAQLVPPAYLGAHVSAYVNHQTGRALPLDFRAATAFFGHFGIEWNLRDASREDLAALAWWIDAYKTHRALLHQGRMVRSTRTTQPS